jgi:protease II
VLVNEPSKRGFFNPAMMLIETAAAEPMLLGKVINDAPSSMGSMVAATPLTVA